MKINCWRTRAGSPSSLGVEVRIDSENWEDLRPEAAVAAEVGAGPDIIISTDEQPQLYPDKLVDVSELANYLGQKYGGWFEICPEYLHARGPLDRDSHRCEWRRHGVPQKHAARGRVRAVSEGSSRLSEAMPGAQGQGYPVRVRARRTPPATPTGGRAGCCGRSADG